VAVEGVEQRPRSLRKTKATENKLSSAVSNICRRANIVPGQSDDFLTAVKALDVAGVDIDAAWEVRAKIRFAADNMRKITEIEEKLSGT
jgi:hypothetical protein